MYKNLFALLAMLVAINVQAEIYKCKGTDGKIQFSDTVCAAGNSAELVPDRAPITPQQQYEAQQRALQKQNEPALMDGGRAVVRSEPRSLLPTQDSEAVKKTAASQTAREADAVANCVRDVERRGAPQNEKAAMVAACRTAGSAQRSTGMSEDTVSNCVRSVERTGASEKEKVRQIALCHGGDVPPVVVQRPGVTAGVN